VIAARTTSHGYAHFCPGIKKGLDAVQATVSFICDNFQTIKTVSEGIALAWAGMKLWDIGAKVAEIFKAIGAVFNVGTATINVAAGVETGGAGKAVGTAEGSSLGLLNNPITLGLGSGVGAAVLGDYLIKRYKLDQVTSNIKPLREPPKVCAPMTIRARPATKRT
jgi:hypothetical protein